MGKPLDSFKTLFGGKMDTDTGMEDVMIWFIQKTAGWKSIRTVATFYDNLIVKWSESGKVVSLWGWPVKKKLLLLI